MILLMLFALPLVLGAGLEYVVCRVPKRRFWRWSPPLLAAAGTAAVALYRYHGWSSGGEKAPIEQLLFIPGLPALGLFLGLWLGRRVWGWLWLPKVIKDKSS